jgi:transposase
LTRPTRRNIAGRIEDLREADGERARRETKAYVGMDLASFPGIGPDDLLTGGEGGALVFDDPADLATLAGGAQVRGWSTPDEREAFDE